MEHRSRATALASGGNSPPTIIIAVTRPGTALAVQLAGALDADVAFPARFAPDLPPLVQAKTHLYDDSVLAEIRRGWERYSQFVLVMASGVAIRAIAPLLGHKSADPAIICMDERGQWVIPLLGGHQAGANDLARRIAGITQGHAAITTASDVQGKPALDRLGRATGWRIDPRSALTHASACLVNGMRVGIYVDALASAVFQPAEWLEQSENMALVETLDDLSADTFAAGLIVSSRVLDYRHDGLLKKSVLYRPQVLVVGMGCNRGVPADELQTCLETTLADAGLALECIATLATVDLKADEPGLRELAERLGVPLSIVAGDQLRDLDRAMFSPSAAQPKFDLPGVAEPCAVQVAQGPLLVPKRSFARCTVAIALSQPQQGERLEAEPGAQRAATAGQPEKRPAARNATLLLIGIGPGDLGHMTFAAHEALRSAEVVIGYQVYVDLVADLLMPDQQVIVSPIGGEVARARQAIDLAAAGQCVALISSGDIGIYAMAGPVFEVLRRQAWQGVAPEVRVFPGVSAIQAVAAYLGAPISHDFCTISLSDLLTPWAVIEQRLGAAAQGDFVVGLYNPRSRERDWQLARALTILRAYRSPGTPVAIARNITRPEQAVTLTTLGELDPSCVDMFTLVLIGSSQSYVVGGRMATPRGYTSSQDQEQIREAAGPGRPSDEPDVAPMARR